MTTTRERGAVLPLVGLLMSTLIAFTAIALDIGRLRVVRRDLQAVADFVALDLSRRLDGSTAQDLLDPLHPSGAAFLDTIDDSRARNDFSPAPDRLLDVELGTVDTQRNFDPVSGLEVPNAVRVTAADAIDYLFRPGAGDTSRSAVAAATKVAGFTLGSFAVRLASSNSAILNAALGDALNVSGLSYQGLASLGLTVEQLGTALNLDLGNPDALLNTDVTVVEFVEATADALEAGGAPLASVTLLRQSIANIPNPNRPISIGDVLGVGTDDAALDAQLNVLEILTAAAFVANGDAAVALPTAQLNLGPLVSSSVGLSVVQSRQRARGGVGTALDNQQLTFPLTATLPSAGAQVSGTLTMADADAVITNIECSGAADVLTLQTDTSLLRSDLTLRIRLGDVPGIGAVLFTLGILTGGLVSANTLLFVPLTFTGNDGNLESIVFTVPPDVLETPGSTPTVRVAGQSTFGLPFVSVGPLSASGGVVGGILNVLLNQAGSLINAAVNTAVSQTANNLLSPLVTRLAGINLTGADLTATEISCGAPQLVG